MCDEPHNLEDCNEFLKGPVEERVRFVKSKGLCFACLKKGHMVRQCQRKKKCQVCKKPHVTALHYDTPRSGRNEQPRANTASEEKPRATSSCISVCHSSNCGATTSSLIIPVWLSHHDDPKHRYRCTQC